MLVSCARTGLKMAEGVCVGVCMGRTNPGVTVNVRSELRGGGGLRHWKRWKKTNGLTYEIFVGKIAVLMDRVQSWKI